MDKKTIKLEVLNISNSQEQAGAFALLLGEVDGTRQLPVIIGTAEAQSLLITIKGIVPPRPLTHNLFASCLGILGVAMTRMLIYKVENGVFFSYIYLKSDETIMRMDARTSDAIALALHMKAPIYIYEDILEQEQLKADMTITSEVNDISDQGIHDPENDILFKKNSLDLLEEALKRAIADENYERAAMLRDEISKKKRK